jgi:hypothetical protein
MGSRTEFPPERVDEVPQRFHARRKASGIGHHEPRLVAVELCPAVIHFDNRVAKVHQTCAEHERERERGCCAGGWSARGGHTAVRAWWCKVSDKGSRRCCSLTFILQCLSAGLHVRLVDVTARVFPVGVKQAKRDITMHRTEHTVSADARLWRCGVVPIIGR